MASKNLQKVSEIETRHKPKRTVVRIAGGLGNQLFTYAFGRSLALQMGRGVEFDLVSGFERDLYKQHYALEPFRVQVSAASVGECYLGRSGRIRRRLDRWVGRHGWNLGTRYVMDPEDQFVPKLVEIARNGRSYFEGYWQSPRYFESAEETLRTELQMDAPADAENQALARRIASCDAIALHARRLRGQVDISGPAAGGLLKTSLPLEYYRAALAELLRHATRPEIFCFADYPEWFSDLGCPDVPVTVVTHNRGYENSWKDLWLMRQCRFHVIADSTFSWWSAWLSERPGKRVVAPRLDRWNWSANRDMLPSDWRQIDWEGISERPIRLANVSSS